MSTESLDALQDRKSACHIYLAAVQEVPNEHMQKSSFVIFITGGLVCLWFVLFC